MKKVIYLALLFISSGVVAQEEVKKDTTRVTLKNIEIILIDHSNDVSDEIDTIDAAPNEIEKNKYEAHWAGIDMGFSMMTNGQFKTSFDNNPYWKNDPARSMTWNLNVLEHKFGITHEYFGITTGLGFSFTQVAFRDNYVLNSTPDTLFASIDSVVDYSKNKLKAAYLTVPLLLEFCTNKNSDKSFYFAAGVVAGVRIASKIKERVKLMAKNLNKKIKASSV